MSNTLTELDRLLAESAIRLALIDDAGPTGGFFGPHGRQPW
ncbi:hypothetical protein [Paenirhodobacter populi]|nr:hypothetical protein [Sinirhodobacter populi]